MSIPNDRKYNETHEWFLVKDDIVTVGISQHAVDELTDITFVELPQVGATVTEGEAFGEIESVKATSELFSAVSGTVVEVNNALADNPEKVNDDPFGEGWFVKIKASSLAPLQQLMDAESYQQTVA